YVDINGNGVFDPVNKDDDQTNKDLVFHFGLTSDSIFSGQFTPAGTNPTVLQFDRMGAYGQVNGVYRFLLDFTNDGVPDLNVVSGLQLNGLPVAGHFNPALPNVSEIALFDGHGNWYIDFNHTNNLSAGSLVIHDGLSGYPI